MNDNGVFIELAKPLAHIVETHGSGVKYLKPNAGVVVLNGVELCQVADPCSRAIGENHDMIGVGP